MDRKLMDDMYCFSEILKKYLLIQIANLDKKISEYQISIDTNTQKKYSKNITLDMVSAIEYSTNNNLKRIEFANTVKADLLEELYKIQSIADKYYIKNDLMANNYIDHYYKYHKEILKNLIEFDFI